MRKKGKENPLFGRPFTEEHKRRISEARRGFKMPEETKAKLSRALRGIKKSPEWRRKIGLGQLGKKLSPEHIEKIREMHRGNKYNLGRKLSDETKNKIRLGHLGKPAYNKGKRASPEVLANHPRGENHHWWKGGITHQNHGLRVAIKNLYQTRLWRSDVFTRDKFTCQACGDASGGNLEAHHIIYVKDILEKYQIKNTNDAIACVELWDINNGKTLCIPCHHVEHNGKKLDSEVKT